MNGQLLFGLVACIGLFFFFMMKGRTRDVVSIVAVVLGCVAIIAVCLNWDTVSHLGSFNFSSFTSPSHAASASAPTPVPTVVVTPTPAPHPTTAAVQTVPTTSPAVSGQSTSNGTVFGLFVGAFFLFAIIFFLVQVQRAKARVQRQVRSAPVENESSDVPAEVR